MSGDFKIRFLDRSSWQPIVTKYLQHSRSVAQVLGLLWARLSRGETLLSHVWLCAGYSRETPTCQWLSGVSRHSKPWLAPVVVTCESSDTLVCAQRKKKLTKLYSRKAVDEGHTESAWHSPSYYFLLLFLHWSFIAYMVKRTSIICLLCYHNMSHVLPFFALSDEDDLKVQAQAWANMQREWTVRKRESDQKIEWSKEKVHVKKGLN